MAFTHAILAIVFLVGRAEASGRDSLNFTRPVRVLLAKGGGTASVRSQGPSLFYKEKDSADWHAAGQKARLTVGPENRVRVDSFESEGHVLYLRGGRTPRETFYFGDRPYRGALKAVAKEGRLYIANVISLEDYVEGILPFEMNPNWELEALKAQAVASRSYALFRLKHPRDDAYDVEATVNDQVYGGAVDGHDRVLAAMASTKGEYLPFRVYFHSRCGGHTDGADAIWGERGPRAGSKPCPSCWRSAASEWHLEIPLPTFVEKLGLPSGGGFRLLPEERSPRGRWLALKVSSGGKSLSVSAEKLRSVLGYTRLKSTFFDWSLQDDTLHFDGRGAGHGVGLCQWGMRALARQGKNYREILRHYYPDAEIRLLSADASN